MNTINSAHSGESTPHQNVYQIVTAQKAVDYIVGKSLRKKQVRK